MSIKIKEVALNTSKYYNLTHPQRRIWFNEKISPGTSVHNIGGLMKIYGTINVDNLKKAINKLIELNDGLRLSFLEQGDEVLQYIDEFKYEEIECMDFSLSTEKSKEFEVWKKKSSNTKFNVVNSKLYNFSIYKLDKDEFGILLVMHHLISDGWSTSVIENQVKEIYEAYQNGNYAYTPQTDSYINFIERESKYLVSNRFKKDKSYWVNKFQELQETTDSIQSINLESCRLKYEISAKHTREIKHILEEKEIPLSVFFIAIKMIFLYKIKSIDEVVIGVPVLNRSGSKEKNIIGMFTSTMPLKYTFDSSMTYSDTIYDIMSELKKCLLHQKYPYDVLVKDIDLRGQNRESLFDVSVNYYVTEHLRTMDGNRIESEELVSQEQNYPYQMVIEEVIARKTICLSFDYLTSLYSENDIKITCQYINNLINSFVENDSRLLSNIDLINIDEIKLFLKEYNSTKDSRNRELTIIDLFEIQAQNNYDKIAIYHNNSVINYGSLNKKINQYANYLSDKGIKSNECVGVIVSHSIDMVCFMLAIIKIGAYYLSIDPNYPIERINYMLNDSSARLLLLDNRIDDLCFTGDILILESITLENVNDKFINKATSNELAYIIYTSGTTGNPKGVMIDNRALVNYAIWASEEYMKDGDIFACFTSISFDLTITSIFAPLVCGNSIDIYNEDEYDYVLNKIAKENRSTVIKLTPSHLSLFNDFINGKLQDYLFIIES